MKEKIRQAGKTHIRPFIAWFFVGVVALAGAVVLWNLSTTLTVF